MLQSGGFLHSSTVVLMSKPRPGLWPNAAGSDHCCSFSLLTLSVWSACHLFMHEPLQCMAAINASLPCSWCCFQDLPFEFIPGCLHVPFSPSSSQKVVQFSLLPCRPLRSLTWSCACFLIPCGCNCTCHISVSEMLLNLYVTFFRWEKSGTAGEKPRPRLSFQD